MASKGWKTPAASGGIVSSTADVVLQAASPTGGCNYLRTLHISHDLLSAAVEYVIKDGSTVIFRSKLQTPANEVGTTITFCPPLKSSAGAALNFALSASVTGGVFVNSQGTAGN